VVDQWQDVQTDLGEPGAEEFADISRALQAEDDVQQTLDAICQLAVALIPGADHAGITHVRQGRFHTPAASSDVARVVDRAQYETSEGPCVSAIREAEEVMAPDLRRDRRWPEFSRLTTARTTVRSMLCFRLFLQEDTLGALNLYAEQVAGFDDSDQALGRVFATHAALAWQAARDQELTENLNTALATSRRIGAAIGILMVTRRITEDEAFDMLRQSSQRRHRKLRDVADDVVFTGVLDDQV
jgi:transcriptional regulator with GAF, ATPase, and Fis domain